jgi:hypothetical protein
MGSRLLMFNSFIMTWEAEKNEISKTLSCVGIGPVTHTDQ